jgi:hypothetical protein
MGVCVIAQWKARLKVELGSDVGRFFFFFSFHQFPDIGLIMLVVVDFCYTNNYTMVGKKSLGRIETIRG